MAMNYRRLIKPTDPPKDNASAAGVSIPRGYEKFGRPKKSETFEPGQMYMLWSEVNRISTHDSPNHKDPFYDVISGSILYRS
jgi:hypothetical protein